MKLILVVEYEGKYTPTIDLVLLYKIVFLLLVMYL